MFHKTTYQILVKCGEGPLRCVLTRKMTSDEARDALVAILLRTGMGGAALPLNPYGNDQYKASGGTTLLHKLYEDRMIDKRKYARKLAMLRLRRRRLERADRNSRRRKKESRRTMRFARLRHHVLTQIRKGF